MLYAPLRVELRSAPPARACRCLHASLTTQSGAAAHRTARASSPPLLLSATIESASSAQAAHCARRPLVRRKPCRLASAARRSAPRPRRAPAADPRIGVRARRRRRIDRRQPCRTARSRIRAPLDVAAPPQRAFDILDQLAHQFLRCRAVPAQRSFSAAMSHATLCWFAQVDERVTTLSRRCGRFSARIGRGVVVPSSAAARRASARSSVASVSSGRAQKRSSSHQAASNCDAQALRVFRRGATPRAVGPHQPPPARHTSGAPARANANRNDLDHHFAHIVEGRPDQRDPPRLPGPRLHRHHSDPARVCRRPRRHEQPGAPVAGGASCSSRPQNRHSRISHASSELLKHFNRTPARSAATRRWSRPRSSARRDPSSSSGCWAAIAAAYSATSRSARTRVDLAQRSASAGSPSRLWRASFNSARRFRRRPCPLSFLNHLSTVPGDSSAPGRSD